MLIYLTRASQRTRQSSVSPERTDHNKVFLFLIYSQSIPEHLSVSDSELPEMADRKTTGEQVPKVVPTTQMDPAMVTGIAGPSGFKRPSIDNIQASNNSASHSVDTLLPAGKTFSKKKIENYDCDLKISSAFPAFPVDWQMKNQTTHDHFIWFCSAAGAGYIIDKQTLSPEKATSDNAMRYGIATIVSYDMQNVTKYPIKIVMKMTLEIVKTAFPSTIMTEDVWNAYNYNQRFSYLGTLFFVTFMTRTDILVNQLMAYAYIKFCFALMGKEPSANVCNLIRNMTGTNVEFCFSPIEMSVWNDLNCVTDLKKQEMMATLFSKTDDLSDLFKVLYNRFKSFGLTYMLAIREALERFPSFPWDTICNDWYRGEMEAFILAEQAVKDLKFPALHKEVMTAHSNKNYRRLAGFCAKSLELGGYSSTLTNHEGLKRVRLSEDKVQFIKSLLISPLSSKWEGLSQEIYDKINSSKICKFKFASDEAAKRKVLIEEAEIKYRQMEQTRMTEMLKRMEQTGQPRSDTNMS
ncbi:uncharacterized protein LOC124489811 isoform X1 [Dermatophagoides farinae]|uniref:uncharacterized protein LOC124489811 isoform X1 n=1 Tax=Dermatophagoides farinae TaxID=6954 RepID=UPI003F5E1463